MAESSVNVTEGSGKRLHTFDRTVSSVLVQDQVVIPGEPHLATYTVGGGATSISTATATSHLLQIMAGSSLNVQIRRVEISQTVAATTATIAQFLIVKLNTAGSGGTSYTPLPLNPADSASGATAQTLPSSKGTEGSIVVQGFPYLIQTVGASTPFVSPCIVWDFDLPHCKPLVIAAGTANGIAIKNVNAIAGASVHIDVWFTESSY